MPVDPLVYGTVDRLEESALTTRTVGGTGLFDGLMDTVGAHLQDQFEKNRITGKEYAEAYVALTQSAMSTAVQFLLGTEQAYWQSKLAQSQLETSDKTNDKIDYELTNLLPKQLEQATAQIANIEAGTTQTTTQTAQIAKGTEKLDYEVSFLLPQELAKATKAVEVMTAEISQTTAQKDQILYQTSAILPAQKLGIEADTDVKEYQLTSLLPAQTAGHTADTATKTYTKDFILPAQLESTREQMEAHRAKTLDTRSDALPVAGSIGKQNELYAQQVDSYKRDGETKVAKMILDAWTVQRSTDETLAPPSSLADAQINSALSKLRTNLAL